MFSYVFHVFLNCHELSIYFLHVLAKVKTVKTSKPEKKPAAKPKESNSGLWMVVGWSGWIKGCGIASLCSCACSLQLAQRDSDRFVFFCVTFTVLFFFVTSVHCNRAPWT